MFQLQNANERMENIKANLAQFLNDDQIIKLTMKTTNSKRRVSQWSDATVQKALSIRTAVGRNGYEHLRKLNFPLPSYRTLCRRLEGAPFAPGIQHDVLEWLRSKLLKKKDSHRECILLVDEMQVRQHVDFDKGLNRIVGYVSPEAAVSKNCHELANHALVFMVRGLALSWKQTVAYLFTGTTLGKEQFWNFMKQVISAVENSGLKVVAVTSDMGPVNTGLWNLIGIKSSKDTVLLHYSLYFLKKHEICHCSGMSEIEANLWFTHFGG